MLCIYYTRLDLPLVYQGSPLVMSTWDMPVRYAKAKGPTKGTVTFRIVGNFNWLHNATLLFISGSTVGWFLMRVVAVHKLLLVFLLFVYHFLRGRACYNEMSQPLLLKTNRLKGGSYG